MIMDFKKEFDGTLVEFKDHELKINNGLLQRVWQLTDKGLRTSQFTDLVNKYEWCQQNAQHQCDWELPKSEGQNGSAKLLSIQVQTSDDEGFSSSHVLVTCKFMYESDDMEVDYIIWNFPDFAGMRTQLKAKLSGNKRIIHDVNKQGGHDPRIVETLPVVIKDISRTYLGYYSDTQNRNDPFLDILKEERSEHPLISPEWNTWSSAVCLENQELGLAMLKESHKCVNKSGHDTGIFKICPQAGLINTGWGIKPQEVPVDDFANSWATWIFCWDKNIDRESAFKKFDRLRYPIHPERDIIIQANTWGSTDNGYDARRAASEEIVIDEIEICSDLGIDVVQIDDGWQVGDGEENGSWKPDETRGWRPHPEKYTDGKWDKVVKEAADKRIKLGLWAPAIPISYEELLENYKEGGFAQFKLDFASLGSREEIDSLMAKVRKFIINTGHNVKVNWDLTEICPRYGYFFAREYGSIYLENRKPQKPFSVIYRPATVLRDLWQISKYVNINKFQCSYQNIDMVNKDLSNASYYNHQYCMAITMMGTPLIFGQTKYLSEKAKDELRPLIKAYKNAREDMFRGYVFPVGDKPNDASWTGFQNIDDVTGNGYLMIFRELHNGETDKKIALKKLKPGTRIKIQNLMTNESSHGTLDENSQIRFSIPQAPDFLFLKYELDCF